MQYRDPGSGSRLVCHSDYSRKNTIIERWWPWVLVVRSVGPIRLLFYGLCGGRWCSIGIQSVDLVWSVIPIIQERIRLSSDGSRGCWLLRVWAQFDLCFMIFVVANGALIGIQAGKTGNDFSWPWSTETKKVDRVLIQVAKW